MANRWNCGDWWPYRGGEDFDGCLEWDDWQSTLECVVWFALLSAETWDQRTDCHSGTQIYVSLLQWKVSNHEVSLLCNTPLGFCCVHRSWSLQTSVWNCGMPIIYRYKTNAFPFSCMHWRVHFRKAWLRDWFSTCLNLVTLLRCCSGR